LRTSESATVGDVADAATEAAGDEHKVRLKVDISASKPPLRSIELERSSASTASVVSTNLGLGIWQMLDVAHVTRLRCNDGVGSLWEANVLASFSSLRVLNLSNAQLPALPGVIGRLHRLQELRLVRNQLKLLPKELGELQHLRVLAIDSNELVILPGELARCTALEELSLSKNKLTNILLNFGNFRRLRTLHLHGNPLEYLPEISPCKELRTLSFANLEVHSDAGYTSFDVKLQEVETQSSTINISLFDSRPTDTLRPVLSILLRRSTGHHALVAGALCELTFEKGRS